MLSNVDWLSHAKSTGRRPVSRRCCLSLIVVILLSFSSTRAADDVVVYGGTSAGVTAAVEAARLGKSVTLIEPTQHLGGLTSGGLGFTDVGNPHVVGGLSREFYHRIWLYYQQPQAWTAQSRDSYKNAMGQGLMAMDDAAQVMWTFEPHAAEQVFEDMVKEARVHVVRGERLDLSSGVIKDGTHIVSLKTESGKIFAAQVFIDASYAQGGN